MGRHKWKLGVLLAGALLAAVWSGARDSLKGQTAAMEPSTDVFSPAHSSISDAMAHFVGYRPEPQQPIAFPHNIHVQDVELACLDCHITAAQGPRASIPDIRTCWGCHATTATDRPEIQKMKGYYDNGHDIPWQRVWGWVEESHVRFNHAPHIRAKVDCATCHGDVAQMTVATRPIQHTMKFCVTCHKEKSAPNDCVTCHY